MVSPPGAEKVVVRIARLDELTPAQTSVLTAAATWTDADRVAKVPDARVARGRLLARGLLRVLLAERLGMPPDRVGLVLGPGGKPQVAGDARSGADRLTFNMSHSRDLVVVAIARGRAVGVDVEAIDPHLDVDAIVRRFFPSAEATSLLASAPTVRRAQFFRDWCRKEALLKADGTGMRRGLHEVFAPALAFADHPVPVPGAPGWCVMDLDLLPGFSCAVAAQGRAWVVEVRPWPEVSAAPRSALSCRGSSSALAAHRR